MLQVNLFGTFSIRSDDQMFEHPEITKALELFCYLLIHREHAHPREKIASLLWENASAAQSKKNLRQTLWQLQTILTTFCKADYGNLLLIDSERLQFNEQVQIALDVREFEQAYMLTQGMDGAQLSSAQVQMLEAALELYRGSLLDGWYQDWCLFERERLQNIYLTLLNKMIGYCELKQQFEKGVYYGMQILRYDRAHERTHVHLMRLYYLDGDRTAALRQYDRCAAALREELNAAPSRQTMELYNLIIDDRPGPLPRHTSGLSDGDESRMQALHETLMQMYQLECFVEDVNHRLQEQIHCVEGMLDKVGE